MSTNVSSLLFRSIFVMGMENFRTILILLYALLITSCQLTDNKINGSYDHHILGLSAPSNQVAINGNLQFEALGGIGPFNFSINSGGGSINSATGNYTAANAIEVVLVQVSDAAGRSSSMLIDVVWYGASLIDNVAGDGFRLNWSPVSEALLFKIINVTSGDPIFLTSVSGSETSYTVANLTPNTKHYFIVQVVTIGGIDKNQFAISATTLPVVASHNGWEHVKALGGRSPVPQATDLATSSASVYLKWRAMTFDTGSVQSYNVYRSTSSGGQDFNSPLAVGIAAVSREYTDSTVAAGSIYYYIVRPSTGATDFNTIQTDTEIKVIVPPQNMVLIHRWIANQEMCGLMGQVIDRTNNYRCDFTGLGGDGTYYDMGYSYFVDTVEYGCAYSVGNVCGGGPCLKTLGNPNGVVTAAIDTVLYDRSLGHCWINQDGATNWVVAGDSGLSLNQRNIVGSNSPGLPPLVFIRQSELQALCNEKSVIGFSGVKRLLSRKEQVAAGSWNSDLTDLEITLLENDPTSLGITNRCNTNSASGLIFDDNDIPTDLETLPWTMTSTRSTLRTGSHSTSNCITRYGAQDMVGNISELLSDQINNGLGITSLVDPSNSDWLGWDSSSYTSDSFTNLETHFLPALGIPWPNNASGTVLSNSWANIHDDELVITNVGLVVSRYGGDYGNPTISGRFGLHYNLGPSIVNRATGGRCSFKAD